MGNTEILIPIQGTGIWTTAEFAFSISIMYLLTGTSSACRPHNFHYALISKGRICCVKARPLKAITRAQGWAAATVAKIWQSCAQWHTGVHPRSEFTTMQSFPGQWTSTQGGLCCPVASITPYSRAFVSLHVLVRIHARQLELRKLNVLHFILI